MNSREFLQMVQRIITFLENIGQLRQAPLKFNHFGHYRLTYKVFTYPLRTADLGANGSEGLLTAHS